MKFASPGRSEKSSGTSAHLTTPVDLYKGVDAGNPDLGPSTPTFFILQRDMFSLGKLGGK